MTAKFSSRGLSQIILADAVSVHPSVHSRPVHLMVFCVADLLQASETIDLGWGLLFVYLFLLKVCHTWFYGFGPLHSSTECSLETETIHLVLVFEALPSVFSGEMSKNSLPSFSLKSEETS